jgi:hypothetical protein
MPINFYVDQIFRIYIRNKHKAHTMPIIRRTTGEHSRKKETLI